MTQTDEITGAPIEVLDETGTSDRRRLAAIGVAAAVVLAAAGWFLIGGGGAGDDNVAFVPAPHRARPAVAKPVTGKPLAVLPAASLVKLGRDPFRPLYVIPVAPVATDPNALAGPNTGPAAGTGTGAAPGTGTGPAVTPTKAPVAAKPTTYALKLSRVDGGGSQLTAKFLIGSTKKIQYARAGSVFGLRAEIRLLSIRSGTWR